MSILSDFEDRVSRAVEGVFSGVFRSPVQPAELAKAVAKEADRGRKVGVGKVYAPTLYNVLLSPADDEKLGGFADTLAGELETYLVGYARERSYALAARPVVRFIVDPALRLGRFEVIGELLSPAELAEEVGYDLDDKDPEYEAGRRPTSSGAHSVAGAGAAGASGPSAPTPQPRRDSQPVVRAGLFFDAEAEDSDAFGAPAPGIATLSIRGVDQNVVLRGERMVIGRLASCDICINDANTSRQHAAFVKDDEGWAIEDLGSTNGTLVNGKNIGRARLRDGDEVIVGVTELVYHEPRG